MDLSSPMQNRRLIVGDRGTVFGAPSFYGLGGSSGSIGGREAPYPTPNRYVPASIPVAKPIQLRPRGTDQGCQQRDRIHPISDPFECCSICKNGLTGTVKKAESGISGQQEPVLLSCGHIICKRCLADLRSRSHTHFTNVNNNLVKSYIHCKTCDYFVTAYLLPTPANTNAKTCQMNFCTGDSFKIPNYRCDCCQKTICDRCKKPHNEKFPDHPVHVRDNRVNSVPVRLFTRCCRHQEPIKYRCSCGEMLCEKCPWNYKSTVSTRQELRHDRIPIEQDNLKLEDLMAKTLEKQAQVEKMITRTEEHSAEFSDRLDRLNNEIACHFNTIILQAIQRCWDVMKDVKKVGSSHFMKLERQKRELERAKRRIETALELDERVRDKNSVKSEGVAQLMKNISYALYEGAEKDLPNLKIYQELIERKTPEITVDFDTDAVLEQIRGWGSTIGSNCRNLKEKNLMGSNFSTTAPLACQNVTGQELANVPGSGQMRLSKMPQRVHFALDHFEFLHQARFTDLLCETDKARANDRERTFSLGIRKPDDAVLTDSEKATRRAYERAMTSQRGSLYAPPRIIGGMRKIHNLRSCSQEEAIAAYANTPVQAPLVFPDGSLTCTDRRDMLERQRNGLMDPRIPAALPNPRTSVAQYVAGPTAPQPQTTIALAPLAPEPVMEQRQQPIRATQPSPEQMFISDPSHGRKEPKPEPEDQGYEDKPPVEDGASEPSPPPPPPPATEPKKIIRKVLIKYRRIVHPDGRIEMLEVSRRAVDPACPDGAAPSPATRVLGRMPGSTAEPVRVVRPPIPAIRRPVPLPEQLKEPKDDWHRGGEEVPEHAQAPLDSEPISGNRLVYDNNTRVIERAESAFGRQRPNLQYAQGPDGGFRRITENPSRNFIERPANIMPNRDEKFTDPDTGEIRAPISLRLKGPVLPPPNIGEENEDGIMVTSHRRPRRPRKAYELHENPANTGCARLAFTLYKPRPYSAIRADPNALTKRQRDIHDLYKDIRQEFRRANLPMKLRPEQTFTLLNDFRRRDRGRPLKNDPTAPSNIMRPKTNWPPRFNQDGSEYDPVQDQELLTKMRLDLEDDEGLNWIGDRNDATRQQFLREITAKANTEVKGCLVCNMFRGKEKRSLDWQCSECRGMGRSITPEGEREAIEINEGDSTTVEKKKRPPRDPNNKRPIGRPRKNVDVDVVSEPPKRGRPRKHRPEEEEEQHHHRREGRRRKAPSDEHEDSTHRRSTRQRKLPGRFRDEDVIIPPNSLRVRIDRRSRSRSSSFSDEESLVDHEEPRGDADQDQEGSNEGTTALFRHQPVKEEESDDYEFDDDYDDYDDEPEEKRIKAEVDEDGDVDME